MTKAPIGIRTITGTPPTITFPLLLAASSGALLIYSAIKGKTPVAVVKDAFGQATADQAKLPGSVTNPGSVILPKKNPVQGGGGQQ